MATELIRELVDLMVAISHHVEPQTPGATMTPETPVKLKGTDNADLAEADGPPDDLAVEIDQAIEAAIAFNLAFYRLKKPTRKKIEALEKKYFANALTLNLSRDVLLIMEKLVDYVMPKNQGQYLSPTTEIVLLPNLNLRATDILENELRQVRFTEATMLKDVAKTIWMRWLNKEWARRLN